jgi:hypothetical protein
MESRLSIAGQAVQPVLVMFPLGLFAMAVLFDVADLLGGPTILGALAYWNIIAGLVVGVLSALAGAVDVMFVRRPQARRLGALRLLAGLKLPGPEEGVAGQATWHEQRDQAYGLWRIATAYRAQLLDWCAAASDRLGVPARAQGQGS